MTKNEAENIKDAAWLYGKAEHVLGTNDREIVRLRRALTDLIDSATKTVRISPKKRNENRP